MAPPNAGFTLIMNLQGLVTLFGTFLVRDTLSVFSTVLSTLEGRFTSRT